MDITKKIYMRMENDLNKVLIIIREEQFKEYFVPIKV